MAPALTEAASQAQKLKIPYALPPITSSTTSSINGEAGATAFEDEDVPDLAENSDAKRRRFTCAYVKSGSGLLVNGDVISGQDVVASSYVDVKSHHLPHGTMNGGSQGASASAHNVVEWDHGKRTSMGLHKTTTTTTGLMTNAGLLVGDADVAGIHSMDLIDQKTPLDTTAPDPSSWPLVTLPSQHQLGAPARELTSKAASQSTADQLAARERFQANLERRTDRLLRRVYKLQTTQAAQHVSRQLLEFVAFQRKTLHLPIKMDRTNLLRHKLSSSSTSSSSSSSTNNGNLDLKAEFLKSKDVKSMSTAALVSLVRKLEAAGNNSNMALKQHIQQQILQQQLLLQQHQQNVSNCSQRYHGGRMASSISNRGVSKQDKSICDDMAWTSGNLLSNLHQLERAVDSDATASSSGGESCDEMDVLEEKRSKPIPCHKRAAWKWAVDRAAVVSRWGWLQAQVSELDFKIRQTEELYSQIRKMKDQILSQKMGIPNSGTAMQVNGFVASASRPPVVDATGAASASNEFACTRTCPMRPIRKRILLRTTTPGCHPPNQRTATRLSSIRCRCLDASRVCVLCCGKLNHMQPLDPVNMELCERVSILDPSFHPVLSFPQEIPMALHFESLLKSGEHGKFYAKNTKRPVNAVKTKSKGSSKINDHARKQSRKLKKNAAATLTAKLRQKLKEPKVTGRGQRNSNRARYRKKKTSTSSTTKDRRERSISESSGLSSKAESPVPSPGLVENSSSQASGNSSWGSADAQPKKGTMLQEMLRRRRGESAYDINNIVIPYSMAAATRVERLQYKEILTPKWRFVEEVPEPSSPTVNEEEDISEEAAGKRHDRCEHEERKRFMGYVHGQHGTARRTRSMRSDSRADSSGANTPDPMSPHNIEHHDSPITTPPATPASFMEDIQQQLLSSRRRTTSLSLSKRDRMVDDVRSLTPELLAAEHVPVAPWDKRTFPLTDQEYEIILLEPVTPERPARKLPNDECGEENAEMDWSSTIPGPVPPLPPTPPTLTSPLDDSSGWVQGEAGSEEKSVQPRHSVVLKLAKS